MFDAHSHVVPIGFYDRDPVDDPRWPSTQVAEDGQRCSVTTGGKLYRTIKRVAWDMPERRLDLEHEGVRRQVVSLMPYLMMYWLEPARAGRYCVDVNGRLTEMAASADGFLPLGTLPLQDVSTAVSLIRNDTPEGIRGFQVGTNVLGRPVASREFDPVFAALEERELPLFIHAVAGACEIASPPDAHSSVAFPSEIGMAVAGLVSSGVLERFPGLRILASHGGGSIVAILPRLRHTWQAKERFRRTLPHDPLEYVQRLYFDSLTFSVAGLEFLEASVGVDRLVLGTDYPFLGRGIGDTVPDDGGQALDAMARNASSWIFG